jgi:hypothetical protein
VKRTAREVGVSYGLLRKWRTEAAFKALVERLEDDFVEAFCAAIDAASDARGPLWSRAWPDDADLNSLADVLDARCGQWIAVNAGDATRYGPRLIGKLTTRLLEDRAEGCLWPLAMLADGRPAVGVGRA